MHTLPLVEKFLSFWQAEVQDIEQLVGLGRQLGACPYYGVRHTIPSAQVHLTTSHMHSFAILKVAAFRGQNAYKRAIQ